MGEYMKLLVVLVVAAVCVAVASAASQMPSPIDGNAAFVIPQFPLVIPHPLPSRHSDPRIPLCFLAHFPLIFSRLFSVVSCVRCGLFVCSFLAPWWNIRHSATAAH